MWGCYHYAYKKFDTKRYSAYRMVEPFLHAKKKCCPSSTNKGRHFVSLSKVWNETKENQKYFKESFWVNLSINFLYKIIST